MTIAAANNGLFPIGFFGAVAAVVMLLLNSNYRIEHPGQEEERCDQMSAVAVMLLAFSLAALIAAIAKPA